MNTLDKGTDTKGIAAIAENSDPSRTGEAIRRSVKLAGGMDWLTPGQTVVIKPALNSAGKFPFTTSPVSCAELVRMCLERGAGRVYVADEMGYEHTILKHRACGKFAGFDKDKTIQSFKKTGIYDAVTKVGEEMNASDRIHITTFREEGWRRYVFGDGDGEYSSNEFTLYNQWVHRQLKHAEKWSGKKACRKYIPRFFDSKLKKDKPGFYVPKLLDKADHIINVFRISSHLWSHYTMAIKNWVGIMRPDDRVWMHQLNYLKNNRHVGNELDRDDPIRTEPLYHEQLADLHLPHIKKERLCVSDATQIILSGGPDGTDRPFYRANLILAASDIIAADVAGLAILRYGTLKAPDGLLGHYEPQPAGWVEAASGLVKDLIWPENKNVYRGTDSKLCDPEFSNWDWVAIQRARELGLGVKHPDNLQLFFDEKESPFAVSGEKRDWITEDALREPKYELISS